MLARFIAVLLVVVMFPAAGHAQSLFEKVKKGASEAVDSVGTAVQSTADMVTDDESPEATRPRLDSMAESALSRLLEENPSAKTLYEQSAGYAVFDVRKLTIKVAGGYGRGVAVDKTTNARTYMNMATGGLGRSFGFGGFESQLVILFENPDTIRSFIDTGYDATAEGGAMFGSDTTEMAARFTDGTAIFVLTKQGWKVAASATGTKYWKDGDLN